ncbi:ArsR/SmtB family transcription factor [Paenibacillus xanthanilyticus]|uniref:ArsR/SmtB family transcription factor n=1 Tax=Paenibacillus xanthanilyticus TaxID=1783531 RepID=A0ABV8K1M8_9BACL
MIEQQQQLLEFGYCEPLEFIAALSMAAKKDFMLEFGREMGIALDEEATNMLEGMIGRLSRHVKREMNLLFGKSTLYDRLDAGLYNVFFGGEEAATTKEWFERYRNWDALDLVYMLLEAVYESAGIDWLDGRDAASVRTDAQLLPLLAAAHPLPDAELHAELLDCARYPEEFRHRTVLLLESFWTHAFLPERERLAAFGEEGARKYEALFAADPEQSFARIARIDPKLVTKRTRVHVSYISQVCMFFNAVDWRGDACSWMSLGYFNDALERRQEDKDMTEKFLKVIADKRRLDLLELLKTRNHYAGELAQLMALTPAAINYHTNLLIDLGLIRITKADGRIYYELDADRLSMLMDQTKRMLLN